MTSFNKLIMRSIVKISQVMNRSIIPLNSCMLCRVIHQYKIILMDRNLNNLNTILLEKEAIHFRVQSTARIMPLNLIPYIHYSKIHSRKQIGLHHNKQPSLNLTIVLSIFRDNLKATLIIKQDQCTGINYLQKIQAEHLV